MKIKLVGGPYEPQELEVSERLQEVTTMSARDVSPLAVSCEPNDVMPRWEDRKLEFTEYKYKRSADDPSLFIFQSLSTRVV